MASSSAPRAIVWVPSERTSITSRATTGGSGRFGATSPASALRSSVEGSSSIPRFSHAAAVGARGGRIVAAGERGDLGRGQRATVEAEVVDGAPVELLVGGTLIAHVP